MNLKSDKHFSFFFLFLGIPKALQSLPGNYIASVQLLYVFFKFRQFSRASKNMPNKKKEFDVEDYQIPTQKDYGTLKQAIRYRRGTNNAVESLDAIIY